MPWPVANVSRKDKRTDSSTQKVSDLTGDLKTIDASYSNGRMKLDQFSSQQMVDDLSALEEDGTSPNAAVAVSESEWEGKDLSNEDVTGHIFPFPRNNSSKVYAASYN